MQGTVVQAGHEPRAFWLGPSFLGLAPSLARLASTMDRAEPKYLDRSELLARPARLGPARWLGEDDDHRGRVDGTSREHVADESVGCVCNEAVHSPPRVLGVCSEVHGTPRWP